MVSAVASSAARGVAYPLGASIVPGGVNFSVYSRTAERIDLLLFDRADDPEPTRVIKLDPDVNKTYYYWHVSVEGLKPGQLYGYRAHGPYTPAQGLFFDDQKVLLDPYSFCTMDTGNYDRQRAAEPGDNTAYTMKSVVVDLGAYDWEGDTPIERPFMDDTVYEMHVRGFTRHPSSGVAPDKRGTYVGLVEMIPYLHELGIKIVELMPVQQFDPQAAPAGHPNYWGYQPLAFFAPHRAYSYATDPLGPVNEFRDMVKALHRANIEVILDVVFNHTAEAEPTGPTLSLRGLDNPTYYILDDADLSRYLDYTGCGNTINGNDTIPRRMILDCLRHWVVNMHVDGFRFDLASILSRDDDGQPLANPPILWDIESDPVLSGTKIIAEAWDAGGLYQVDSFVGDRWCVWNGRYRDSVRRFLKGDNGVVKQFADSLVGSIDLYHEPNRDPTRSINFVTAHDGFTLNDLVSYNDKHNEANGDENRDGSNDNYSWNCGVEGPTNDPEVEALRARQVKNFLTTLFLAQGRPMLLMGDEVRRTQMGNNNAYCQDNEISWFDWDAIPQHGPTWRFARKVIAFHQQAVIFRDKQFWGQPGSAGIIWHGVHLNQPDWGDNSHSLALEFSHPKSTRHLHVMFNAYWEPLEFELPPLSPGDEWLLAIDTALPSPEDFPDNPQPPQSGQTSYMVQPRSVVILVTAEPPGTSQGS
jgi:glycogen operon protein